MIVSVRTDTHLRKTNQDFYGHQALAYGYLIMVCDGMGGARAGHVAAEYVVTRLPQLLDEYALQKMEVADALHAAVTEINSRVLELGTSGDPEYRGLGTTLVFALVSDKKCWIGHVGDSRAYLWRTGHLTALTQDHSPIGEMVARGIISPAQARKHANRSVLSKAIGTKKGEPLELSAAELYLQNGDLLLLCTDGLSGFVDDSQIEEAIGQHQGEEIATALLDLAKRMGSDDNITLLIAQVPGETVAIPLVPESVLNQGDETLSEVDPGPSKPRFNQKLVLLLIGASLGAMIYWLFSVL